MSLLSDGQNIQRNTNQLQASTKTTTHHYIPTLHTRDGCVHNQLQCHYYQMGRIYRETPTNCKHQQKLPHTTIFPHYTLVMAVCTTNCSVTIIRWAEYTEKHQPTASINKTTTHHYIPTLHTRDGCVHNQLQCHYYQMGRIYRETPTNCEYQQKLPHTTIFPHYTLVMAVCTTNCSVTIIR